MSKISGKINLMQLTAALRTMKGQSGEVECLVIPINQNRLFKGEKGIYLDLIAFEIEKKGDSKDTHLVKQSLSKADREIMTDEEIKAMPILGNLQVWSGQGSSEPASSMEVSGEDEDLPF
ncbi:MAG TPA: hypothetical protein VMW32_05855 [Bacteroidales bacterium]|nr:hypothetical protein [Bacteroidales bacterium]